jgi:predicted nucleotidyltransferase
MEQAVLRTLCYHHLFDYPLTLEEMRRFLIGKKASLRQVRLAVKRMSLASSQKGYFFLKGEKKTVKIRKRREKTSEEKLKIAKKVAGWLKYIPSVKMVAVTGALAVNNTEQSDDIDFLIITSKGRLWLTRALSVLLIELLASRPRLDKKRMENAICLNIFLEEGYLTLPPEKRNLFTAHEACQMKVIWQKNDVYQKFLKANLWLKKFLPN